MDSPDSGFQPEEVPAPAPLEQRHHGAVGGADGQQVHDRRLDRRDDRPEDHDEQDERDEHDATDDVRQPLLRPLAERHGAGGGTGDPGAGGKHA
jgi:hypothetical protein